MFLRVSSLGARYGSRQVVFDVSFAIDSGQIGVVLGANGAGKSTTLKAMIGLVEKVSGKVSVGDQDVTDWPVSRAVDSGIGLVPDGGRVFADFTVEENLRLGAFTVPDREVYFQRIDQVVERFPILGDRLRQSAGTLSGGERQMLAIGRALMSQPSLLMLDEPFAGLAPIIIQQLTELLRDIAGSSNVAMLIVEQNIQALEIADKAYVMRLGKIILEEEHPFDLLADRSNIEAAYLG